MKFYSYIIQIMKTFFKQFKGKKLKETKISLLPFWYFIYFSIKIWQLYRIVNEKNMGWKLFFNSISAVTTSSFVFELKSELVSNRLWSDEIDFNSW